VTAFEEKIKSAGTEIWCSYSTQVSSPDLYVIILTGDGVSGTQSSSWGPLVKKLVEHNLGVLQFDFISQGKSSGDRANLNIKTGIANFNDAMNFFMKKLNMKKTVAIGSSFGATVLLHSEWLPHFHHLILKSPAINLMEVWENEHLNFGNIERWQERGISEISGLSFDAYRLACEVNAYGNLCSIKCPVTVIHGDEDEFSPVTQSKRLTLLLGKKCELVILSGVRHDYKQNNALTSFADIVCDRLSKEIIE